MTAYLVASGVVLVGILAALAVAVVGLVKQLNRTLAGLRGLAARIDGQKRIVQGASRQIASTAAAYRFSRKAANRFIGGPRTASKN